MQETFERVLRRPREIAREEDALPYLLGVLRNTWVDTVRSRARRPTTPLDLEAAARIEAPAATSSPLEQVAAREVFAAVAALPEEFRDVLAAVDVAGLSYAEAAEALDLPIGTVMSRLSRGRERVAEALGRPGLEGDLALGLPARQLGDRVEAHAGEPSITQVCPLPPPGDRVAVADPPQPRALGLEVLAVGLVERLAARRSSSSPGARPCA